MITTINRLLNANLLEKNGVVQQWTEYRVASGCVLATRTQPYAADIVDYVDINHAEGLATVVMVAGQNTVHDLDDTISINIFKLVDPIFS